MCLEWRRSWNNCRWPERAIFTTQGISDHLEATNYFIGNGTEHFGASTVILLADTKNMERYREDAGLNKYQALFTQPRPFPNHYQTLNYSFKRNVRPISINPFKLKCTLQFY